MTSSERRDVPEQTVWGRAEIHRLEDLPTRTVGDTYRQAAVRGDTATVGINWFEPGHPAWPAAHHHPFDQLAFVLRGSMRVTLGAEQFDVHAPAVVWIPKDMPHSADVIGDEPCLNIDVFGLVRSDFEDLFSHQRAFAPQPPSAGGVG